MSDDGAVVFVIDDDESMRRSLATLLGHAQDAGEIDRIAALRSLRSNRIQDLLLRVPGLSVTTARAALATLDCVRRTQGESWSASARRTNSRTPASSSITHPSCTTQAI